MHILSNGFNNNLPSISAAPQGGTENFARAFINHILSSGAEHRWTGVILNRISNPTTSVRLHKVFSSNYRCYYHLRLSITLVEAVTKAPNKHVKPEVVWAKPIERLVALIRTQKPDVVFLNGFGTLNWMILKAAERTGVPVVIQHAGIMHKELEVNKHRYTPHARKLLEDMERESTSISAVEIFLNQWSKEYYSQHVAKGKKRTTEIIPLPFDFATFEHLSNGKVMPAFELDKSHFNIGVIGRWDEIKNHAAVLALAKAARQKKLPWRFHSVVNIPEAGSHKTSKAEYEQYINVIPPMDRGDISRFCKAIDLLLVPSLFDVSPTVVLEALALDTPVAISPNVGFINDFLAHGGAEWIVDPVDPHKALRTLKKIKGKKMPTKLKEHLRSIHDHHKVFSAYLEIFEIAKLRTLPMTEVLKELWQREITKYVPPSNPRSKTK